MSPQLSSNTVKINDAIPLVSTDAPNACSPKQVVESILRGLKRAQKDFGIRSSLILCCICGHPGIRQSNLMQKNYQNSIFNDRLESRSSSIS